jgi:hypothetical protein
MVEVRRPGPVMGSSAFLCCERCNGLGFLRAGAFADRTYPRCPVCKGLGQAYLHPIPEPPVEAGD